MPNTRSAAKRRRADQRRNQRNVIFKSELKSLTRKFQKLSQGNPPFAELESLHRILSKRLDQATHKGFIHRNAAARKKSRLARFVATLRSS